MRTERFNETKPRRNLDLALTIGVFAMSLWLAFLAGYRMSQSEVLDEQIEMAQALARAAAEHEAKARALVERLQRQAEAEPRAAPQRRGRAGQMPSL